MFKTLFGYFKPHIKIFILDMCCAVFIAVVDLAFPIISRKAMYEFIPDGMYKTLFIVMGIVTCFYLLRSIGYYIMTYWGHTFGVRVEADIRRDLFTHLQELDFGFYDRNRTGTLMSRLTGDLFEITELSHHGPEDVLIASLTIIGALIYLFTIQWRLALVLALLLPIVVLIVIFMRKNMSAASVEVKRKMADINADAEASISGIKTSKAFANQDVDYKRFDKSNSKFKTAKSDYYKAMGKFNASQDFFLCIFPVVVITVGGKLIMDGRMDYIDLITFTLFVNAFITPIRKLVNFAEILTNGTAGLKRFMEIMAVEPNIKDREDAEPLRLKAGQIDINDIYFSYDNRDEVIDGIDLHIKAGETVAIVGHSGGGKTTLCQLIPRFYDVESGNIKIDGQDIRDVTMTSLAENIGIVQQDVFIFADTIMNNIRYGRPSATDEEVEEAAKQAKIYDDIMAMPDGFNTYVGERGTMLSGGQKQRISIARIFLKDPRILILDEATSALDSITEQAIQKSFDELSKGRTSLVIAHRLATVRNADRIVLVEKGKVIEEGTHQKLMQLDGGYAALFNTQKLAG